MRFLQLSLQNFGPYRQRQTLNLETTAERPLILLGGMNGGGKTTLMDALRLALYGQRARCSARGSLAYGDFLRQSRHRHSAPEELTEIELILEDIVDGQPRQYSIRRVWDSAVKTNRDRLEVTVGAWQDEALTQTWDEYIEKLFPLGISNLFLFDGEQVKELAEREEPTPEILQAMRGLLGLELPNTLYQDLTVLINRKSKDGAAPEERRSLEELENWVQEAQAEQGEAAAAQASLQGKLDRALAELREAREAFYREGGKISAQQTQLQQTLEELRDAEKRQTEEQLKLAAQDLPLAQIRPLLDQALIHGKQEQEYELRALTYDQLLAQSRRFERLLEQLALTESQARQAQTFLAQEQTEPALLETWLEAEPETLHLLESLLRHSLPDQGRRSQQLQGELDQTRRRQTEVERLLAGAAAPEAYEKLRRQLEEAERKVDDLTQALQAAQTHYAQSQQRHQDATRRLQHYAESLIAQQERAHFLRGAAQVQQTLLRFGERLKRHKLNQLEIQITQSFLYLLHKPDLIRRLEIDSESFGLRLYDGAGQAVPQGRLSAGEKQLLAIALLWGLARASGRRLPVAIDTPLGRLDSSHRRHLLERYFPQASHQVLLLSTDTEIGPQEAALLRESQAISREYLIRHQALGATIEPGYFG